MAAKSFGIQVRIYDSKSPSGYRWAWVHPTGGQPYRWPTVDEATRWRNSLYPQCTSSTVRVSEFDERTNT